ncbi:MAG: glutamine--fructose-6-phosphate transaminase (isomerizing), partial [Planktothrix sp.]
IDQGKLDCVRAKGKLFNLKNKVAGRENAASIGIGHTRWATHGKPEEYNAHPHLDMTGKIAVVQNGIVENYRELKAELTGKGYQFVSDTDTEVIPHLISDLLYQQSEGANTQHNSAFFQAVQKAVNRLQGAFAIAVLCADYSDELIVARQQAPISIGFGQGEFFCASDTPALVSHTQVVLSLENGELARLTHLGVEVYNFQGDRLHKIPRVLNYNPTQVEKQTYKHFMLKEIHEQPAVVRSILDKYIDQDWIENAAVNKVKPNTSPINLGLSKKLSANLEQVEIYACGTSWHASLVGKYLLEQLAQLPTTVNYASEARYAPSPLRPNSLIIGVTQSGETADTLAAIATEQQRRAIQPIEYAPRILGITNRAESSIAQIADHIIDIQAGIEIGVAATKTFTAQVMAFYLLA